MISSRKFAFKLVGAAVAMMTLVTCGGGSSGGGSAPANVQTYVSGASFPSAIRFTPDGRLFYTELTTGNIRVVQNDALLPTPFATLSVSTATEQGLLGLAIDPDFTNNHYVYAFYTLPNGTTQRVVRFTDVANLGTAQTTIVDNLPANLRHNGGRIAFGPDGKLYVTIGDNTDPANSQNPAVIPGKLLRYNSDGSIPGDNPVASNPMFALGLRNPFGIAFYPGTGTPYLSENGPTCDDEIDRIVPGGNYGWRPLQPCGDSDPNYLQPTRRYSGIIVPTGIAFYTGSAFPAYQNDLLVATFGGGTVRRLTISDTGTGIVTQESVLAANLGNALDVAVGPDGFIYVSTESAILRIVPSP